MSHVAEPRVLFVCMGNICRSPLAEGIARAHAARRGVRVFVDSAGTEAYHVGESPDARARRVARARATPIDGQRARQVQASDFVRFDWLFAADQRTLDELLRRQPGNSEARVQLLLAGLGLRGDEAVPDPYYDDYAAFEYVYELLDEAMPLVLDRIGGKVLGSSPART